MWTNPATGRLEELNEVKAIFAGEFAAYALLRNGHLLSWGDNHNGELGTGADPWHNGEFPPAEVRRAGGAPLSGVSGSRRRRRLVAGPPGRRRSPRLGQRGTGRPGRRPRRRMPPRTAARRKRRPGAGAREPRPARSSRCGSRRSNGSTRRPSRPGSTTVSPWPGARSTRGAATNVASSAAARCPAAASPHRGRDARRKTATRTRRRSRASGPPPRCAPPGPTRWSSSPAAEWRRPRIVWPRPNRCRSSLSWQPETSRPRSDRRRTAPLPRSPNARGEPEPAEQGGSESEEGPPQNIGSEPAYLTFVGEPLKASSSSIGEKLTAEPGGWSGARPIAFSYQWQRCDAAGEGCLNIAGATHPGYLLAPADVGATVRAVVTATGAEPPPATVATETTDTIAGAVEGESTRNPTTSVKLGGDALSFAIDQTIEKIPLPGEGHFRELFKPLEAVAYEVQIQRQQTCAGDGPDAAAGRATGPG